MSDRVDLYDSHYGHLAADPQVEVRRETYGEDLGQTSWITAPEAEEWFARLALGPGQRALEVGCGSGGLACLLAVRSGAACVGVDINPHAVAAARRRAEESDLATRVRFEVVDAAQPLPFPDESFDAVYCNDSINHLPGRLEVLAEWYRILQPGGRALFTDPIVVTGQLSNEEIRIRSSIGFFLFTPHGHNERMLGEVGFVLREVRDVTAAEVAVSQRWWRAREARQAQLVALEGEDGFTGLQRFLHTVHSLAAEGRLSRYQYLALRPA
jgi:SAM-dependent methyltransferase